jgi:hypothetical protein
VCCSAGAPPCGARGASGSRTTYAGPLPCRLVSAPLSSWPVLRRSLGPIDRKRGSSLVLDPAEALASTENALRLIIRTVLGEDWKSGLSEEERASLLQKQADEATKRAGVYVSTDLIDYTELYVLTGLILRKWERFSPVFKKKARIETYFSLVDRVRNSIAHSRPIVEFERELLSGIATYLRVLIAEYRTLNEPGDAHYPLIESVVDDSGAPPLSGDALGFNVGNRRRFEVGDRLRFSVRGTDPRARPLVWELNVGTGIPTLMFRSAGVARAEGSEATIEYVVTEDDVSEEFYVRVFLTHAGGKFHRKKASPTGQDWDDSRTFFYAVNPPLS